jgi:hypothetical protein
MVGWFRISILLFSYAFLLKVFSLFFFVSLMIGRFRVSILFYEFRVSDIWNRSYSHTYAAFSILFLGVGVSPQWPPRNHRKTSPQRSPQRHKKVMCICFPMIIISIWVRSCLIFIVNNSFYVFTFKIFGKNWN